MAKWVYYFGGGSAEGGDDKTILGGKGASLAAMVNAHLPVPPGFTISTECCRMFLESNGRWPDELESQVRTNLKRLEQETGRTFGDPQRPLLVSVRSGAAASMPGMMDTLLNCGLIPAMAQHTDEGSFWRVYAQFSLMFGKTVAGIPAEEFHTIEQQLRDQAHHGRHKEQKQPPLTAQQAQQLAHRYQELYTQRTGKAFPQEPWDVLVQCIEAVFRSWNNDRAITYRREHDIRGLIGTAVNVQAMFPSEVSGIVFTINPNDFSANEMIIEASYGLGEAVVSGDVHPDMFVLDRQSLAVKRSVAGRKNHVFAAMGDVKARDAEALSLSPQQIDELARMSMNVEKFFGKPMDIEWGFADGKLALLQSRAVRGLEIAEDVEIGRKEEIYRLRELAGKKRRLWIKHNLGETLPAPTPMTWDIVRRYMSGSGGYGKLYRDLGYLPSRRVMDEGFLELICGRIYADPERAAEMFWDGFPKIYDIDELAKNPRAIEAEPTRFDAEKADGYFLRQLIKLIRGMRKNRKILKNIPAVAVERFEKEVLPPYLDYVKQQRQVNLQSLSTAEVIAQLRERARVVMDEFAGESLLPGFLGGLAQASLQNRLCSLMGQQEGQSLTLALTQGLPGDSTIEQNVNLYKVGKGQMPFAQFTERYGHRAVGEMELSRPRYREDSSYLRQLMSAYLDDKVASPEQLHHANVQRRIEAEKGLPDLLAQWGGTSFTEEVQGDLEQAQAMLPYRESGKHYLMMGYELIRLALMELSRRWDLGRDIFYLQLGELDGFEADKAQMLERIKLRKIRYQSARKLEVADVIDSKELEEVGMPRKYESAKELPGEPIASGVASGVAHIIFEPSQAADLCTDYILVCPSTDPSWTALFVHARGLVVEQGGVLSHGAIVARDYGIPAVVCPDATKRIPDRAMVRVDGKTGMITLLEQ